MKRIFVLFFIGLATVSSQTDSLNWKQYARIGGASAEKINGGFGYYSNHVIDTGTEILFLSCAIHVQGQTLGRCVSLTNKPCFQAHVRHMLGSFWV